MSISNGLSSDVAVAILTKRKELNRDPSELLNIVLTVHVTLQELSAKAYDSRHVVRDRFLRTDASSH